MKSYKLTFLISLAISLFLCIKVSWADQWGKATIMLPRYIIAFFNGTKYEDLKEIHEIMSDPRNKQRVFLAESEPFTFSWTLKGTKFRTTLISSVIPEKGFSAKGIEKQDIPVIKNETTLSFSQMIAGAEFIHPIRNKKADSMLTYTITVGNDSNVHYEFAFYLTVHHDTSIPFKTISGSVKGKVNYHAAVEPFDTDDDGKKPQD